MGSRQSSILHIRFTYHIVRTNVFSVHRIAPSEFVYRLSLTAHQKRAGGNRIHSCHEFLSISSCLHLFYLKWTIQLKWSGILFKGLLLAHYLSKLAHMVWLSPKIVMKIKHRMRKPLYYKYGGTIRHRSISHWEMLITVLNSHFYHYLTKS